MQDIDQALDAANLLDRDIIVTRSQSLSLGVSQASELPTLVGTEHWNPAYTSTRLGAWPALADPHQPVIVRLRVPAGTKGLYLGSLGTAQHEAELLLPRGLSTRIIGVQSKVSTAMSLRPQPQQIWFVDQEIASVHTEPLR